MARVPPTGMAAIVVLTLLVILGGALYARARAKKAEAFAASRPDVAKAFHEVSGHLDRVAAEAQAAGLVDARAPAAAGCPALPGLQPLRDTLKRVDVSEETAHGLYRGLRDVDGDILAAVQSFEAGPGSSGLGASLRGLSEAVARLGLALGQ